MLLSKIIYKVWALSKYYLNDNNNKRKIDKEIKVDKLINYFIKS